MLGVMNYRNLKVYMAEIITVKIEGKMEVLLRFSAHNLLRCEINISHIKWSELPGLFTIVDFWMNQVAELLQACILLISSFSAALFLFSLYGQLNFHSQDIKQLTFFTYLQHDVTYFNEFLCDSKKSGISG